MTTRGLRKGRIKFRAWLANSGVVYTSSCRYLMCALVQIQQKENLIDLINKEGFYNGGKQRAAVFFFVYIILNFVHVT